MTSSDGAIPMFEGDDQGCPWCKALPDEACIRPDGTPCDDHCARVQAREDAKAQRSGSRSWIGLTLSLTGTILTT